MNQAPNATLPADFDLAEATWFHYSSSPAFDYPIDYAVSVIEADVDAGRIDFLGRWAPESYCHYHRHLGTTMAAVIEGEQHLTETTEYETVTKVRSVGFTGEVPDGEQHMERAGTEGLTMLFSVHSPDGRLFEVLNDAGEVLVAATISEFLEQTMASAS